MPLLRILECVLQSRLRHPHPPGCDVDSPCLQSGHHLLEAVSLLHPDEIFRRDAYLFEEEFYSLDPLVSQLFDISSHAEARIPFFHDKQAHPLVNRFCLRIGLHQNRKRVAVTSIGDKHLRTVQNVMVAGPPGGGGNSLNIAAGMAFR